MKANIKNKEKKQKLKKKPIAKTKREHVLVVAQEFKFARLLSGNEKKTRDRVLKALKKWLLNCFDTGHEFKEDDFTRIWKGLFYAMWMSDKPLIQEELCESIAGILDLFPAEHIKHAVLMTKAGLKVLATEWYGIDQHRMDKFLMLVRRYLRGSLRCLLRCKWNIDSCKMFENMLSSSDGILALKTPSYARNSMSMILHFIDCYLEELAKVSEGNINEESLVVLLRPFCALVCGGEALALCVASRRLLTALLRQSDLGLQYSDAERAWQKMGCPPGGPEALELVSDDEEDEEQNNKIDEEENTNVALDPRAGRVNTILPLLPVPAAALAASMRHLMQTTACASRAYQRANICVQRFEQLSKNVYPLRVKDTDITVDIDEPALKPEVAARNLRALEKRLVTASDELALRGLSRKHRKRLLAKSRSGLSIIEDVPVPPEKPTSATNGNWEIEETSINNKHKKNKREASNKENITANKKKPNKKRKLEEKPQKDGNVKKLKVDDKKVISQEENEQQKLKVKQAIKQNNKVQDKKSIRSNKTTIIAKSDVSNKKSSDKKDKNKKPIVSKISNKESIRHKVNTNLDKITINNKVPKVIVNKVRNNQKMGCTRNDKKLDTPKLSLHTPKKVKFVLKNNGAQAPIDYYKSVRQSPNIPFDSSKLPTKTNLKPSTPSPINPFFKRKIKMKR